MKRLNRGIKKLRKARRKAREKTADKRKLLYKLNSKLHSKNAELDDINGYIDECNANIETLRKRVFMNCSDINSKVGLLCSSMSTFQSSMIYNAKKTNFVMKLKT